MKQFVIIVAGGTGTRMGSEIPKQFLLLDDRPVLIHTLSVFYTAIPEASVVIALPENTMSRWTDLLKTHHCRIPHRLVPGGETRFHSVRNALDTLPDDGIVAIHDGARPLVSAALIRKAFEEAERAGNAVPVTPVNESMRFTEGEGNRPVDRSAYHLVQTPQVFRLSEAHAAFRQEYRPGFTDDATVLESSGVRIHLIEGDPSNIKITEPGDLFLAHALMSRPFHR